MNLKVYCSHFAQSVSFVLIEASLLAPPLLF